MDWGNFFKKAGAVVGSVAVRAGASGLMRQGPKAQGRDFVDGVIGGLLLGRKDPLSRAEVAETALDYAISWLGIRAYEGAVDRAIDHESGRR